ncbi:MAG: universal stress protein [Planctomycetes bacterium]|nr:universal stress protein [Planctomycetota bacterium]
MSSKQGVLICLDLSPEGEKVLAEGVSLAKALGTGVLLLHVAAPEPDFVGYDEGILTRDDRARELRQEHSDLLALAERLSAEGVPAQALLISGAITPVILEQAERHDVRLVVVGSHGHGALHRFLIGSTTDAVVRRSPRTVVVVRALEA